MIFTGLSNNWALLQRVTAIEKYLKENSINQIAKSTVNGTGTDTHIFDKSNVSKADNADLTVNDLIICPDCSIWQVISIASTGKITARFLVNIKGEQGEQGATGPQGPSGNDKLYEHTIIFEQQGHTRILVQLYTRSATPMSYDDVASYLNHRETSASGIHNASAFNQTTPKEYVYSAYAHEGVIYLNHLLDSSSMSKTIHKEDVTTTDTVWEI